jgi:hypothetical protein
MGIGKRHRMYLSMISGKGVRFLHFTRRLELQAAFKIQRRPLNPFALATPCIYALQ